MYSAKQLRRGLAHPNLILREMNRLYHTRMDSCAYNRDGLDVMHADWDNLLLLDACRYDMFESESTLPGRLTSVRSRGSNTVEFLRGNVAGRDLRDVVYVTANPQYHRHREELDAMFHAVINIWESDGWDDEYNTVLPEVATEYAERAAAEYPDKRLFVHYVQPHYPFLNSETQFDKNHLHNEGDETIDFWHEIFFGKKSINRSLVWEVYVDNLRRALPHVNDLMESLTGKTVVTADHGNMVGERAGPVPVTEWGHPKGIYVDELVKVPWLEYENGERRKITASDSLENDADVEDDVVMNRLKELGYTE